MCSDKKYEVFKQERTNRLQFYTKCKWHYTLLSKNNSSVKEIVYNPVGYNWLKW